jgi:eukaryotic-like serine/threonine-protein kinase
MWWGAPLAIAALGAAAWTAARAPAAPPTEGAPHLTFGRLTLLEGISQEPSISPDGKWVVYVNNANGNQDLYLQSTTGQTAINLTKDSPANDYSPAFSPDGELIAFRSERDGGGLFVMGRTGESVRRIADTGFLPAWFPDGRSIVYDSVAVATAES